MMNSPETKKRLLQIAEVLEKGWCQWDYAVSPLGKVFDQDTIMAATPGVDRFCLRGALLRVSGGFDRVVYARIYEVLLSVGYLSLTAFNDAPGRTQAEVVKLVRKAAEEEANDD